MLLRGNSLRSYPNSGQISNRGRNVTCPAAGSGAIRRLILLRHADSESSSSVRDHDRQLTPHGRRCVGDELHGGLMHGETLSYMHGEILSYVHGEACIFSLYGSIYRYHILETIHPSMCKILTHQSSVLIRYLLSVRPRRSLRCSRPGDGSRTSCWPAMHAARNR